MNPDARRFSFRGNLNPSEQRQATVIAATSHRDCVVLLVFSAVFQLAGCVSDKVGEQSAVTSYQQTLADQGPQERVDTKGRDPHRPLDLLKPTPSPTGAIVEDRESHGPADPAKPVPFQAAEAAPKAGVVINPNTGRTTVLGSGFTQAERIEPVISPAEGMYPVEVVADPNTGEKTVSLTIEQAVARALANSPEIRVVSFDPSIAKQDVTKAASEFDVTAFGRVNYEEEDNPVNSIFQPGQSDVRTWETGIKQKGITGSEWSLTYGLTRNWDDLIGRALSTRYEPMLSFQLRQPLLRDAWEEVNLAGVNVAKLNYKMALFGFREKAEDTAAQVISAYWRLLQARRGFEIQEALLDRTLDTLNKVEGRKEIDATDVQIKQTEASAKAREAALLQAGKAVSDAQDVLVRLMADSKLTVLDGFQIIPASSAALEARQLETSNILKLAMQKNPTIQRARIGTEIADINIRVAENQDMPRLDLVASTRTQGLARGPDTAQDRFNTGDFASYAVGLSLEIPLGNRQRKAELLKRRLERRQAIAALQNVADQVAIAAKEGSRRIQTNHSEIQIQEEAAEAARIHLQALEDSEPVRERLTPEFLLVKLQAQEGLANAQRAEMRAVADFNISLAKLARTLGTVLELHQVKTW